MANKLLLCRCLAAHRSCRFWGIHRNNELTRAFSVNKKETLHSVRYRSSNQLRLPSYLNHKPRRSVRHLSSLDHSDSGTQNENNLPTSTGEICMASLLEYGLRDRTVADLDKDDMYLLIKDLENGFYDQLSNLPWLQDNRLIAFIQLLLADQLVSLPRPIWNHHLMPNVISHLMRLMPQFDNQQLTATFLSLMHLGVMYTPYMEGVVHPILLLCHERMGSFDLKALNVVMGIHTRTFQRDYVSMNRQLHRFTELLAELSHDWSPEEAALVASIMVSAISMPSCNVEKHAEEPLQKLLRLLKDDQRYLQDPDTICLYMRLARKLFMKTFNEQVLGRQLIRIASNACLKNMHKFNAANIAESCAALRQSRCFTHELIEHIRKRSLELLNEDCKLTEVSNLMYCINQHAPLDMKRRFESAIFQRLQGEVDSVILSNLAENFTAINLKNPDLLMLFQSHIALQSDKLAMYTTRFNKIVRLLIRKPFILTEHEAKFKEAVLTAIDNEVKVSNLALYTLYMLPSTTTGLNEDYMERILNAIPKLRSFDLNRIAMGINQMRLPITSNLRKQIASIQSALSEQIINKSEEIDTLDYLYQITMEIVVNNRKRDPTLTTHLMEMYPRFTKDINDVGLAKTLHVFHEVAYYLPEVYDDLVDFVIKNYEDIQIERLAFLLSALAKVGYIPKRFEEYSALMLQVYDTIEAKGDIRHQLLLMRSLNILQCYPERQLLELFSIDTIERLDDFITKQPLQKTGTEQTMMTLNRNVLLECPELDIPWFHQQYIEDSLNIDEPEKPRIGKRFRDDVESVLIDPEILSHRKNLVRHVHSPYGYLINFECILNHKNEPVPPVDFQDIVLPADWQRLAILTLTEKSYTCNSRRLLGLEQLRWRHLEIMGYRVVEVPYFEWYSMGLSDYHAKVDFLSTKIFNS